MKKHRLFTLLSLGLLVLGGGLSLGLAKGSIHSLPVVAEAETFECSVVVTECKNGTVTVDKTEGHVGEIVTISAKHDMLYLIKSVSVNGTELVEDEEIAGKYSFALVEGENKVEAKFVIDEELLGEMSVIMEQAKAKDWSNLFSVENVIRLISFLFSGGLFLAIVRYYIKDKKLEGKVENKIEETVQAILPQATQTIILSTIKDFITPMITEMKGDSQDMKNAMTVFSRCFALAQENTPEARIAITKELSSLKLGDQASIAAVQKQLEEFVMKQNENFINMLDKMKKMEETNKQIIAKSNVSEVKEEIKEEKETHPYE